jgi:type II secretory pathway component GspD/PulD (secretin)
LPLPGEAKPIRLWFRLINFPAADAAKEVRALFDREQIPRPAWALPQQLHAVLICSPDSNSLFISAPPQLAESAAKLLTKLDARPKMVTIQVCLGELKTSPQDGKTSHGAAADARVPSISEDGAAWFAAAKKHRRIEVLERPQVTTLDRQPANVQIGQRVPLLPGGRNYEPVGATLSLTPRILPDGRIDVQLDFDDFFIDPKAAVLTIRKSGLQTTLTAKEGQTVIVRVSGARESIVALTPQIVRSQAKDSSVANSQASVSAPR